MEVMHIFFDGMAYVQQSRVSKTTFGEFTQNLLSRILSIGKNADRIDIVFGEYRETSIKILSERGGHKEF